MSFFRYTTLPEIRDLLISVPVLSVILNPIAPAGNNYKMNYS